MNLSENETNVQMEDTLAGTVAAEEDNTSKKDDSTEGLPQPLKFIATMFSWLIRIMPPKAQLIAFYALLFLLVIGCLRLFGYDFKDYLPGKQGPIYQEFAQISGEVDLNGSTLWTDSEWNDLEFSSTQYLYMRREYQQGGNYRLFWIMKVPASEISTGGLTLLLTKRGDEGKLIKLSEKFLAFSQFFDKSQPYRWVKFNIDTSRDFTESLTVVSSVNVAGGVDSGEKHM